MEKKGLARVWSGSFGGTSIRWMGRRTSRMGFRCSAWCWGWSDGRRVLLAKDVDGEMVAGVIYDPLRDEMFVAERGMGAWLNGKRIHVSKTKSMQEALTATGFPSHKRHENPNVHFLSGDYAAVAWGEAGGECGAGYGVCGLWADRWVLGVQAESVGYIGGVLVLIEEAGGTVTHFDGEQVHAGLA